MKGVAVGAGDGHVREHDARVAVQGVGLLIGRRSVRSLGGRGDARSYDTPQEENSAKSASEHEPPAREGSTSYSPWTSGWWNATHGWLILQIAALEGCRGGWRDDDGDAVEDVEEGMELVGREDDDRAAAAIGVEVL